MSDATNPLAVAPTGPASTSTDHASSIFGPQNTTPDTDPSHDDQSSGLEPQSTVDIFESRVHSVCDFGDVVFVLKNAQHPTMRLRVSSCIMATASSSFRAMLEKGFAEGHDSQKSNPRGKIGDYAKGLRQPREVHVEDDDPEAFKAFCRMLHFKDLIEPEEESRLDEGTGGTSSDSTVVTAQDEWGNISYVPLKDLGSLTRLPRTPLVFGVKSLFQIAKIANKYLCVDAVRFQMDALIHSHHSNLKSDSGVFYWTWDLSQLCATAYLLRLPHHFRHFSKALVRDCGYSHVSEYGQEWSECLPARFYDSLNMQRIVVRAIVAENIDYLVREFAKATELTDRADLRKVFEDRLRHLGLWPVISQQRKLSETLESLEYLKVPVLVPFHYLCSPAPRVRGTRSDFEDENERGDHGGRKKRDGETHTSNARTVNAFTDTKPALLKTCIRSCEAVCVGMCLECAKMGDKTCQNNHHDSTTGLEWTQDGSFSVRDPKMFRTPNEHVVRVRALPYWEAIW